jgi:hypothetical protein
MFIFDIRMTDNSLTELICEGVQLNSALGILESSSTVLSYTVHGAGIQILEASKPYFALSGFTKLKDRNY